MAINQNLMAHLSNHCKVTSTVTQTENEAEWLRVRTRGIGGSDIGAICGVSPWTTARQIYFNKVGMYKDEMSELQGNATERMYFGHVLEPIVADEFYKREIKEKGRDWKVVSLDASFAKNDEPWMLANVDRMVVDTSGAPVGILECKTTSEYMNSEWAEGDILESYIYQLNWYMGIMGVHRGWFACLVGGNKFYIYEVMFNETLFNETLVPKGRDFWFNHVLKLCEPPLTSGDTDLINKINGKAVKGTETFLNNDIYEEAAATIVALKAEEKRIKAAIEANQNLLKEALGENEKGFTSSHIITWSPRSQTRVDTEKLKTDFPEVYLKVQKKVNFRAMSVKEV